MRLKSTLISLISVAIIAITGILLYVYWPAITGTINNSGYLTPEQGQQMYDKGYEDGNRAEEEQLAQIAYYKQLTDDYYIQVGLLNNEISQLNGSISSKNETITELTNIKNTNLQTISDLNDIISANETTISGLNTQIADLQSDKTSLETQIFGLNSDIANKQVIISGLNSQVADLQADITAKRNQLVNLNGQIADLQAQMSFLQNNASSDQAQIENLQTQITALTNQKTDLQSAITDKNSQIASLNTQISSLNSAIVDLQSQILVKENTIATLNSQISSLQSFNTQLAQTNQSNANTITALNTQIVSLNSQISTLTLQIQNNSSNVTTLNNRISELESSIAYYENFIAGLQSESQVVATFMYDGSVYNIQVLNKNSYASVTAPTSTIYKIFNGWKVNGQSVNLANYQVSANTTFVADVTYKYDVQFMVDDQVVNSQIVTSGAYATTPTAPTKTNYQFDGWTINGSMATPNTYAITENTTFVAKFTRLYTVTFTYESTTLDTQTVRSGEYATNVAVNDTTYKIFNGWKADNVIVAVGEYAITADTTFVADITYKYDVIYQVDDTTYNSQLITAYSYAALPANPTKNGYEFDGWTLNGSTVINPTTILINSNTTFIAKFTKLHTVIFIYESETKSTQIVRNNEYATNVAVSDTIDKVFNGWKLNGVIINIANTPITANTTFVADITYKCDVIFQVDGSTYSSQVVTANSYATAPTNPVKAGYTFDGWTINGIDVVNVANTSITENTIFIAKFTINTYTVTFTYESSTYAIQNISYGSRASDVSVLDTTYKIFNGWKYNGIITDVTTVVITGNTEFVADITYRYDVIFQVDGSTYNSQVVTRNNYATTPINPSKTGYTFNGWYIKGNTTVINVSEVAITSDITFVAKFTINSYTVNFISDGKTIKSQNVNYNSYATAPTNPVKAGYEFAGWTLNNEIVTVNSYKIYQNTNFIVLFTQKSLQECSWSEISEISNNGTASSLFKVGDEKSFILTTGEQITVAIMGFNHDTLTNGNGKAGITFGMRHLLSTTYNMNESGKGTNGWTDSKMRIQTMSTLFSDLPIELQNAIKEVNKLTNGGSDTTIQTTADKLWLFSAVEITGITDNPYNGEGSQYEFWKTKKDATGGEGTIKNDRKLTTPDGSVINYWLRTPTKNLVVRFRTISETGGIGNLFEYSLWGVCFGFCI